MYSHTLRELSREQNTLVMESTQHLPHGDIVIVDDNLSNLKSLTDILTVTGYRVQSASNGESALRCVESRPPELVLLDYMMEGMNGIEVCRHIKSNPKTEGIPVIFLSAHGDTDIQLEALQAGGIDYVIKPIKPTEVLAKIDNHLRLYRLQCSLRIQSEELKKEIEERKLAEEELSQSLEREQVLADIVRDSPLAIAFGYPDGRLVNCNNEFSELTGYTLEELQKINWNETLTPDKWQKSEAEALGQLSPLKKSVRYQKEYIHKNGERIPIELVVAAKYDSAHTLVHYIGFIRDISKQKIMEEQLLQNEKLTTIAGLAAGVSHEINTPLSAILQSHQLIEMGLSAENANSRERAAKYAIDLNRLQQYLRDNELDYFLDGIRESALNASHIVKSLQEFSIPHEGSFSSVNLNELMEEALLLSQSDYDMKKKYGFAGIQVVKKFSPDLPLVNCSAMEIEQVLLSLIKNSVQFLFEAGQQENPRITLRTSSNNTHAVIEVADNGPGIPEDIKNKVFDPFFTTREVGTGTGLGLSVSHAIVVDKHKGKIRVESEPGKGAKFVVELPLNQNSNH